MSDLAEMVAKFDELRARAAALVDAFAVELGEQVEGFSADHRRAIADAIAEVRKQVTGETRPYRASAGRIGPWLELVPTPEDEEIADQILDPQASNPLGMG